MKVMVSERVSSDGVLGSMDVSGGGVDLKLQQQLRDGTAV
jgi:hypothetical protein